MYLIFPSFIREYLGTNTFIKKSVLVGPTLNSISVYLTFLRMSFSFISSCFFSQVIFFIWNTPSKNPSNLVILVAILVFFNGYLKCHLRSFFFPSSTPRVCHTYFYALIAL